MEVSVDNFISKGIYINNVIRWASGFTQNNSHTVVFLALADNKKKAIRAAFKDFEDFTCLRFKERKDENDYIEFQKKIKGYGHIFTNIM